MMDEGGTPDENGTPNAEVDKLTASTSTTDDGQEDRETKDDGTHLQPSKAETANAGASTSGAKKSELLPVSEDTIATLSTAFIQGLQPHFEHSKESLHELIRNQELLLDTVQQENRKYEENQMLEEVNEKMKKVRLYQTKLVNIRKEMVNLHDRVGKLKKRALKLQSQRMKMNLQREQQKEREYEEDRLLRARPASSHATSQDPPGPPPGPP